MGVIRHARNQHRNEVQRSLLFFPICAECCKDDVSSISCNESTLHTSNISSTEICLLVAMVLRSVSPIVRASNLYCFTGRLFSICFRLGEGVRTEDPPITDHNRERADPGHSSSVPCPGRVSKDHHNREWPGRGQKGPLWKGPATQLEEARYWLQQWREAATPKEEVAKRKNLVRRKPPEVRE